MMGRGRHPSRLKSLIHFAGESFPPVGEPKVRNGAGQDALGRRAPAGGAPSGLSILPIESGSLLGERAILCRI